MQRLIAGGQLQSAANMSARIAVASTSLPLHKSGAVASSPLLSSVSSAVNAASISSASAPAGAMWQSVRHFTGEMRHHNTDTNNTRIPWDFTLKSYEEVEVILSKFPRAHRHSAIIPLLHLAQRQQGGYIPVTAMYKIARICEVPPMRVFEVVTFYSMFNRKPVGKYHMQFCVTTPCMLCGGDELLHKTEHYLNLHMFGTTKDGLITLGEMECLGACVNAPMLVISDYSDPPNFSYNFFEDLTFEHIKEIVAAIRGERPGGYKGLRIGSQRMDRRWAEPPGGRTSLFFEKPPGPYCRDIDTPPPPPPPPKK